MFFQHLGIGFLERKRPDNMRVACLPALDEFSRLRRWVLPASQKKT